MSGKPGQNSFSAVGFLFSDRLLGIPTMRDRAMQALYALALNPIAETLADHNSYGFRQNAARLML